MSKKTRKLDMEAASLFGYLNRRKAKTPEAAYSGWVRESGIIPDPDDIPALMQVIRRYQEVSAQPQVLTACEQALSSGRRLL